MAPNPSHNLASPCHAPPTCFFSWFISSFSAVFFSTTCCASRRRRLAMCVERLRPGAAPSNTNTGRTLWKSSLRGLKGRPVDCISGQSWKTTAERAPMACRALKEDKAQRDHPSRFANLSTPTWNSLLPSAAGAAAAVLLLLLLPLPLLLLLLQAGRCLPAYPAEEALEVRVLDHLAALVAHGAHELKQPDGRICTHMVNKSRGISWTGATHGQEVHLHECLQV